MSLLTFVETKLFTRLVQEYLSDDEYGALQQMLVANPQAGDVIPGAGGVRKVRWSVAGGGKRGGIRVIYYLRSRPGPDLDVDPLCQERGRQHPRARFEEDQGGDRCRRVIATSVGRSSRGFES
jgi:hypothetical protein